MIPTPPVDYPVDDTRQLLDFAGYSDYLIPLTGTLVAKDGPLPQGYTVIPTDYVLYQVKSRHMEPALPAGAILRGEVVSLSRLKQLESGVYLVLSRESSQAKKINVSLGRLRDKPSRSRLTLWPDNPDTIKQTLLVSRIAFVFRVVRYRLTEPAPLPPPV